MGSGAPLMSFFLLRESELGTLKGSGQVGGLLLLLRSGILCTRGCAAEAAVVAILGVLGVRLAFGAGLIDWKPREIWQAL